MYKSKETQRWAETAVKNMLILAELQFQQALSLEGSRHSEPWIYHFMLAKISYKLKKPASVILEHFVKVITTIQPKSLLHNNMYREKVLL